MSPLDLTSTLNPDQHQAVTHTGSPLLILAGAGSGKTRVLIYRTAYLIDHLHLDPTSILLLTFTNKAAGEMQHRLQALIPNAMPFAGTFHRFSAKFLRSHAHLLGFTPYFSIYDDADQLDLVKHSINLLDLSAKDWKPRVVLSQIGSAKNELLTPSEYHQLARGPLQQVTAKVYQTYQQLLHDNNAMDFDDLLLHTLSILNQHPQVTAEYRRRFSHLLIDEYQDTNRAQYLIAKTLSLTHHNITVVGDASQSIYRWRGADFRNLEYLANDFADLTTIRLEQNYRSTQTILDAAHSVISHNRSHPVLKLWTQNDTGSPLTIFQATDESHEAAWVINTITSNSQTTNTVILYRTNAQSRAFEEVCIRRGIPYILVGGVRFYDRKEIKDIVAYLRLLLNPNDLVSLNRATKLGVRRLKKFQLQAPNIPFATANAAIVFDQVLDATDYLDKLDPHDEADQSRIENLQELRSVATQFDHLSDFLEQVALVENLTTATDPKQRPTSLDSLPPHTIVLMTAHAAKGLEFDHVYIVGLEEGLFPHSRSLLDPQEIEEERRLCYVALTRARQTLTLTYAQNRLFFGGHLSGVISRFVSEIPSHLFSTTKHLPSTTSPTFTSDNLDKFLNDEIDIDQLFDQ